MTRPYFQVHAVDLLSRSKWKRTPPGTRGALLTLWVLASARDPEGRWSSRAKLEEDLAADCRVEDMKSAVDRLIELGWIDCDGDECVVHDWLDWQPPMPKSGAQRKREERERAASVTPVTHVTRVTKRRDSHTRRGEESTSSSLRSEESPPAKKPRLSPRQVVLAWLTEHKVRHPVGYLNLNLNELIDIHGADTIINALAADRSSKTIKQYVVGLEQGLSPSSVGSTKRPSRGGPRPIGETSHAFEH